MNDAYNLVYEKAHNFSVHFSHPYKDMKLNQKVGVAEVVLRANELPENETGISVLNNRLREIHGKNLEAWCRINEGAGI